MKTGKITIKFTQKDAIKANKMASRDMALENATGFIAVHKTHKSIKDYTRTPKHRKVYSAE